MPLVRASFEMAGAAGAANPADGASADTTRAMARPMPNVFMRFTPEALSPLRVSCPAASSKVKIAKKGGIMTTTTVRPAEPADSPLILGFIRELAEYERLLDKVRITEAGLEAMLFGPRARAFCDIAEVEGTPAGFAFWFYNVSTFEGCYGLYLEDLYVKPELRGHGIGTMLLAGLAKRCLEEGLARMEWSVLDWNAPSIAFYDALGATSKTEWITRQLRGEALAALAARVG